MLILLAIVCNRFSILYAQSSSDTIRVTQELDAVVISAERINKEIIPVQALSGQKLQALSVHSVADAVRYFSGVQIKDYGGIGGLKTVNIRSMGSHHVGVFYDGIELGNAQNGVVDLGRFSLDNMEAVTLYNGQKSAIFQAAKDYASASAIYLQTRKPSFRGQKRDNINIGMKAGSFDTYNPSLLYEHMFSDKLSASLSTEYLYTSGKYKFTYAKKNGYDTTEVRKNGDLNMLRVEAALFGTIKDGEWRAKAYYYTSERGYPGASVREEPGKFKHQDRQWDDNFFLQGSINRHFGSRYILMLNGKYAHDYLHYLSDPRLDVSTMYVNNHYLQRESYVSASQLFVISPQWSASHAVDFQHNTLDADLVDFVYPSRYTILSAAATSFSLPTMKIQASLLHTYVIDHTKTQGANAKNKSIFTPSVIASWKPLSDQGFNLRAYYKKVFRMPTLNDLYYTFIGNKDLNPEYTNQYNAGVTYTKICQIKAINQFEIQVDAYFNQVKDKIIAMPTSNQFRWTMINLGYVEIRGIDVAVQSTNIIGNVEITPRINYTFQKAQDFTDPTSQWYGGQIPYIPWHSGSVIINATYKDWYINYSFIYTGERYEAVANILENYAQPWYTHDMSITRNIHLNKSDLKIAIEVNNILNQQYEVVQCYPMPGTNFKIKVNYIL